MKASSSLKTRIYGESEKNSQASSSIEETKLESSSMRHSPIDTPVLRQNRDMGAQQQAASEIDVDQRGAAETAPEELLCFLKTKLGKYKKHSMIIKNDILRLSRASATSNISDRVSVSLTSKD